MAAILKYISVILLLTLCSCENHSVKNGNANDKSIRKNADVKEGKTLDASTSQASRVFDLKPLSYLMGKINKSGRINDQDATFLFQFINPTCREDSMYAKQVNEMILRVLENSPNQFAFALSANIKDGNRKFIFEQVRKRLRPLKNIKELKDSVADTENTDSLINSKLVNAIENPPT